MKPNQLERPQKTFFFERPDGTTFATKEDEAWAIYRNKNQVIGWRIPPNKLIGVSDGTKMHLAVQEAHKLNSTNPDLAKERILKGYDEELESARGHIEIPRDMDTIGRGGQPIKISELR